MGLRIGIVGTGKFAGHHARVWQSIPDVAIVGVHGSDSQRLAAFAEKFSVKGYPDFEKFLEGIDILDIVNANNLHADFALRALDKVRCVIIEKPVDTVLEKAVLLARRAREQKAFLSVVSQLRFQAGARKVKALLERNALGDIAGARILVSWPRGDEYFNASGGWRKDKTKSGGGVLLHQCIHFIDLLQWFFGNALWVTGYIPAQEEAAGEVEKIFVGTIGFKGGITAQVFFSTLPGLAFENFFEIIGTKGHVMVSGDAVYRKVSDNILKTVLYNLVPAIQGILCTKENASVCLRRQFLDILRALEEKTPPLVTVEDGVNALITVNGLYQAAEQGIRIEFDRTPGGHNAVK